MNPRIALYELAHQHQLDSKSTQRLFDAAGFADEPLGLRPWFWKCAAVLAAVLTGLGIITWLAANWESLGRMGQFALLQGTVLAVGMGAAAHPKTRGPLGLLALLCTGGLFAYFGQTYQTGADAWQLFALWAALTLPLCLGARTDVLWAPWALVAITAISLWTFAHTGHRWRAQPQDLAVYALAWVAAMTVVTFLSPALTRFTGAGPWALRTSATLAVMAMTLAAIAALFGRPVAPHYPLALALFALAAAVLAQRRVFEVFVISAVALGLNILLVAGFVRWLYAGDDGTDHIAKLLLIGLVAAGLLAASVSAITRLVRRYEARAHP